MSLMNASSLLIVSRPDFAALADPSIDAVNRHRQSRDVRAHATDVAQECVESAYRIAGTAALYRPNIFERLLRDVHGATQHIGVHDGHFTDVGARHRGGEPSNMKSTFTPLQSARLFRRA